MGSLPEILALLSPILEMLKLGNSPTTAPLISHADSPASLLGDD